MCESCLDLVDAVVGPIPPSTSKGAAQVVCHHEPPCTYRRLRPAEAEEWMARALPRTWVLLAMRRLGDGRRRPSPRMEARKA